MSADPGVRSWAVLRRYARYRAAWAAAAAPAFEAAPFPVRIQSRADLGAAPWRLLAWEDPGRGDAESPFWIGAPTVEGALRPGAPALETLAEEPGAAVEGLRLLDGTLVLKITCGAAVVRIRLRERGPFPPGGGIEVVHGFGLRMPHTAATLFDFWTVAGEPVPSRRPAPGGRTAGS